MQIKEIMILFLFNIHSCIKKNLCCQNPVQFVKVMDLVCWPKLNVDIPLKTSRKLILMQKIVCPQVQVHGQLVQKDVSIIQRINVFTGILMPREGKITKMFKFVQIQHVSILEFYKGVQDGIYLYLWLYSVTNNEYSISFLLENYVSRRAFE